MSSVDSTSNRASNHEDSTKKKLDEQRKAQQEQAKRTAMQIRQIQEQHAAEINEIRNEHREMMERFKQESREAMSQRDMRHQKEIEDLRDFHNRQIQRQAADAESRETNLQKTTRSEIESRRASTEQQKQIMTKASQAELAEKDRRFKEYAEQTGEYHQKETARMKENLNKAHEREMTVVAAGREEEKAQSYREYENLRQTKDQQLDDLERKKLRDQERLQNAFSTERRIVAEDHASSIENGRQNLAEAVENNQRRYQKALEERDAAHFKARGRFEEGMETRINNDLDRAKADNATLKAELHRQHRDLNEQKQRELNNLKTVMSENVNVLQDERGKMLEAHNEKTARELVNMKRKDDDLLMKQNRFYQDKLVIEQIRAQERLDREKLNNEQKSAQSEARSDIRFKKLSEDKNRREQKLTDLYHESGNIMADNYADQVRDIRARSQTDQDEMTKAFTKRMIEVERRFQDRLSDIQVKYEAKMSSMQTENLKLAKSQAAGISHVKKEYDKRNEQDLAAMKQKYEIRIEQEREQHEKEVDMIKKRHEETLNHLTSVRGVSKS